MEHCQFLSLMVILKEDLEPTRYLRVEIHTNDVNTEIWLNLPMKWINVKQKSLAFEFNNNLI